MSVTIKRSPTPQDAESGFFCPKRSLGGESLVSDMRKKGV